MTRDVAGAPAAVLLYLSSAHVKENRNALSLIVIEKTSFLTIESANFFFVSRQVYRSVV